VGSKTENFTMSGSINAHSTGINHSYIHDYVIFISSHVNLKRSVIFPVIFRYYVYFEVHCSQ